MLFFYAFIVSFAISFVGSLQPGPVNIAVLASSFQKRFKNAIFIAIGGSLPEFLFSFIAFKATSYIVIWYQYFIYFQIIIVILLLIAGLYLWFNKTNIAFKTTQKNGFLLGFTLAVLNPQLILFWTTVITYIQLNGVFETTLFENNYLVVLFCFGASFGALTIHVLLIFLSNKFLKISLQSFFKYANKIIAIIFVILAIVQIIKLLN